MLNTIGIAVNTIKGRDIKIRKRNLVRTAPLAIQKNIFERVILISPALYITAICINS